MPFEFYVTSSQFRDIKLLEKPIFSAHSTLLRYTNHIYPNMQHILNTKQSILR